MRSRRRPGTRPTWRLSRRRVRVSAVWREGNPAAEIVKAAEESGAEVILLGTRRRSELEMATLGSVAAEVIRRAVCSVLTVREKQGRPLPHLG